MYCFGMLLCHSATRKSSQTRPYTQHWQSKVKPYHPDGIKLELVCNFSVSADVPEIHISSFLELHISFACLRRNHGHTSSMKTYLSLRVLQMVVSATVAMA